MRAYDHDQHDATQKFRPLLPTPWWATDLLRDIVFSVLFGCFLGCGLVVIGVTESGACLLGVAGVIHHLFMSDWR